MYANNNQVLMLCVCVFLRVCVCALNYSSNTTATAKSVGKIVLLLFSASTLAYVRRAASFASRSVRALVCVF